MQHEVPKKPKKIEDRAFRFDAFTNGKAVYSKTKNRLPAMGWNSWNAFGSGNTEALTKAMADAIVELGLDKLGYQYVVLDDGCYKSERIEGELSNEEVKFPSGFKALSDYVHEKGLLFGMYNDIGTNLCAGAAVGTCGHEETDAASYLEWGVDFLKVDNCYYLWDNATFSDATNAKYVYAPNIKGIRLEGEGMQLSLNAVADGRLTGRGGEKKEDYVTNLGTFDGTGPDATPVGVQSGELEFRIVAPKDGEYKLYVNFASGEEPGCGSWLQVAVGNGEETKLFYDDFLISEKNQEGENIFSESAAITVVLKEGENTLRLMNHRRQENTLDSYATLLKALKEQAPQKDILLSICEWGKTQPHNWGYKVGDSWRILNDITFRVGSDGDPGVGSWIDGYTTSVTTQYNKAVIMDEFAGLDKGWNDPDMLMVGMNGLTEEMCRTHFAMWCMMNSPLMLGLDLRRVKKGDWIYQIIANKELIAINQDALGIQAKRIYCSLAKENPDTAYIRDTDRVDVLAKPLADGGVALSFINVSDKEQGKQSVTKAQILERLGEKLGVNSLFGQTRAYKITDVWSGESWESNSDLFEVESLPACGNVTWKVTPVL